MAIIPADELTKLAAKANRQHVLAENSFGLAMQHAIASGEALIAAKAQLKHGEWLPWLTAEFNGDVRTAQNYMKCAANTKLISHLTMSEALRLLAKPSLHVTHNSGENEWYTPSGYIEAARVVLGGFDLDPASSEPANTVVQADRFYSLDDDGLAADWSGRVWLNPPYAADLVERFTDKLVDSYSSGAVTEAIVLVNNATETQWFQKLAAVASVICFPAHRVRYWNTADGEPRTPLQGQAFIYLGPNAKDFTNEFRQFGLMVEVS